MFKVWQRWHNFGSPWATYTFAFILLLLSIVSVSSIQYALYWVVLKMYLSSLFLNQRLVWILSVLDTHTFIFLLIVRNGSGRNYFSPIHLEMWLLACFEKFVLKLMSAFCQFLESVWRTIKWYRCVGIVLVYTRQSMSLPT